MLLDAKTGKVIKDEDDLDEKEFWDKLDTALHFGATEFQCVNLLGVSESTIVRRIKERFGNEQTFFNYRKEIMDSGVVVLSLKHKAVSMGMKGNPGMLIYALNNLAGWSMNPKKAVNEDKPISITIDADDAEL